MLVAVPLAGWSTPSSRAIAAKRLAVLARVDRVGRVPRIGTPAASSPRVSLSGVCPPSCTITPSGCSRSTISSTSSSVSGSKYSLSEMSKSVETVSGIRVDHDRLEALLAQRERRLHAAVVELDALPDAVRAAAEDDDPASPVAALRSLPRSCSRGTASPPGIRRRRCRPCCRSGGFRARPAARARRASVSPRRSRELAIAEPHPLHAAQSIAASTPAQRGDTRSPPRAALPSGRGTTGRSPSARRSRRRRGPPRARA